MEGGALAMSKKERCRLVIMSRVRDRAMTIREASEMVGVSYRQGRRIYKRYREEGDRGLIHRNRGQPSNRRKPHELKGEYWPCTGSNTGILGRHWQRRSLWNGMDMR